MSRRVDGLDVHDTIEDVPVLGIKRLRTISDTNDQLLQEIIDTTSAAAANALFSKTLFGETIVQTPNPITQTGFLYGIPVHSQLYTTFNLGPGPSITSNADRNAAEVSVLAPFSLATLRSARSIKYRPGQTNTVRVHCAFDTPEIGTHQVAGVGNATSLLCFTYDWTDASEFKVMRSHSGVQEIVKMTITTPCSEPAGETATVRLGGEDFLVNLTDSGEDGNFTAYEFTQGVYISTFQRWTARSVGLDVIFTNVFTNTVPNDYLLTSLTCEADFEQIRAGNAIVVEFFGQSVWNGSSPMIQNVNPQQHNLYEIEYSWLGGSNIHFKIYNPDTNVYEIVHTLSFANQTTTGTFSLVQPNMYPTAIVTNLFFPFPATPKTLTTTGFVALTNGQFNVLRGPKYSVESRKTIPQNVETNIVTLGGRCQVNGVANVSETLLQKVYIATDGTKSVTIRIKKNPTLIGAGTVDDYLSWQYVNEDESLTLFETTSVTHTGGATIASIVIPKGTGTILDFREDDIFLGCEETLVITAESTSSNIVDISVALIEDI